MSSNELVISRETAEKILNFRNERNWSQFHNPKDLAISISLEAAELLECFQWSGSDTEVESKHKEMKDELSDIFIYAVLLADRLKINLDEAINQIKTATRRYAKRQRTWLRRDSKLTLLDADTLTLEQMVSCIVESYTNLYVS